MSHRKSLLKKYNKIEKEAQIMSVLSSIVDSIVQDVQKSIKETGQNPVTAIGQFLLEGYIATKFGFAWTVVVLILDKVFNVNVKTVLDTIKSTLVPFVSQKDPNSINPESDSNTLTDSVLSKLNINKDQADAPIDDLADEAKTKLSSTEYQITKTAGLLSFSFGAIIKTIIKALLKGFAISTAGGAIVSQIKKTPDATTPVEPSTVKPARNSLLNYVGQPSGFGTKTYTNDADIEGYGNKLWQEPIDSNFSNTFMNWIESVYPNMPDHIRKVLSKNFDKGIKVFYDIFKDWNLAQDLNSSSTKMRIPSKYKSIKQIVDEFLSMFTV